MILVPLYCLDHITRHHVILSQHLSNDYNSIIYLQFVAAVFASPVRVVFMNFTKIK